MQHEDFDIDELPELDTAVGVFGSAEQGEVGGEICVNIAVGIYIFSNG